MRAWGGEEYAQAYVIALLLIGPVTVPLIQNIGIEIQRAKNMHQFRSKVYFCMAIGNAIVSVPLGMALGGIGCALGTAISMIVGNGLIMNWYYQTHIGLDMRYFWKNILKIVPAMLPPIVLGILAGAACGSLLAAVFRRLRLRDSAKVLILLSISFLLVTLEDSLSGRMGFSGLIAVVAAGVALQRKRGEVAARLSAKYAKLWVAAELLLFVLVGATVDLRYAAGAGTKAVLLIFLVLLFRMLGVWVCLLRTRLSLRERAFCMLAYCPKATVQAAIGSIPLGMGLACGDIVLTVAVLSILITAPLGAFAIDCTYQRLLKKN